MGKPDQFDASYQRRQERKKALASIVSSDDPPLSDAPVEPARKTHAVGRNDACPCGSGRKYKKCCGKSAA